ncbi:MAG TPA: CvpA family protein [Pirellulales bacterium]
MAESSEFIVLSYDIIMLVVLAGTTLWGAMRGMAWQVASLASIVLSSLVAMRYSDQLAPHLGQSESTNHVLAMLILYLVTSLGIWIVFRLVSTVINRVRLKEFDRQLGALFGAAKGVLWCLLITFFAVTGSTWSRHHVLESRSGHYMAVFIHQGEPLLPKEVHDAIGGYLEQLDRGLDPTNESVPEAPSWPPASDASS